MGIYQFKLLDQADQFNEVWNGTLLGDRTEPGYKILLYDLEHFYVEVYFSIGKQEIERLRTFVTPRLLEPYLDQLMGSAVSLLMKS